MKKILHVILFIGTYFIFSINLCATEHSEKVGEYKRINVSNKIQLYKSDIGVDENKITIFKYNLKDLNLSFQVLNLGYDVRFIKWENEIIPLIQPADGTDYFSCFYSTTKRNFYLLADLMTQERPRYDVIEISDKKLNYLGVTERDNTTNFTDNYYKLLFNLKIEKGKPVFYYKKKNKIEENYLTKSIDYIFNDQEILYNVFHKKNMNFNKNDIRRYFKNFEIHGTPYGKKYLSQKEVQKIKKSNKSYQVYQELNKYDILGNLIEDSNYLHLLEYYTSDLEYWGAIDYHTTDSGTLFMLVRNARKISKDGKQTYLTMPIDGIEFNPLNDRFTDGRDNPLPLKYPKIWLKIFKIYHLNKSKEYLYLKKKTFLYKKPNNKNKSKKFLIKNYCALIVDKTHDGWYQVFFYHPHWKTNTIMWIKFDAEKHGLIR